MSNTWFTSLSGMLAASFGLQNTSNNVANMQSPGFKRNDVFYSSLGHGDGEEGSGSGVYIGGSSTNFSEGRPLETSNPSDLAIVGQGFFVIRLKNGELFYTRSGEFEFNNGLLIDKHSGGQVQGYNSAGNLVPIHQNGPKTTSGKASHEIFLSGDFKYIEKSDSEKKDQIGQFKNKYRNVKFEVKNVFDAKGQAHQLSFEFQSTPVMVKDDSTDIPDDGKSWDLVSITCDGVEINHPPGQKIIFTNSDGSANSDNNTIKFALDGTQEIALHFGTFHDGADKSVQLKDPKLNPGSSTVIAYQIDGYGEGKQMGFAFDENGLLTYIYDNGQSVEGVHIGLAAFDDLEHSLIQSHDNLFRAKDGAEMHYGVANKGVFGRINAKHVEASNVDSTVEFANIVILQRMFQACSQIMEIDKQLLEGLISK